MEGFIDLNQYFYTLQPTLDKETYDRVRNASYLVTILDADLKFQVISMAAEREWKKTQLELENKTVEDIFPEIIASKNYRNMIQALQSGLEITDVIDSRSGKILKMNYIPIKNEGLVTGLIVTEAQG